MTSNKARGSADIYEWDVEDEKFWEGTGKKIATRNLWISIPSLLCGFAVWLYWSVITVQMLNLGFPFTNSELGTRMSTLSLVRISVLRMLISLTSPQTPDSNSTKLFLGCARPESGAGFRRAVTGATFAFGGDEL